MEIKYSLIAYILITAILGIYGVAWFFQSQRNIGAILFLILSVLVFVFFGLRWFGNVASSNEYTSWPPVINTCPDYLTAFMRPVGNGKKLQCVDLLGVSTKAYGQGAIEKWSDDLTATSYPQDDKYYFDPSPPTNLPAGITPQQELCNRCLTAGLTWEGICDGENCYAPTAASVIAAGGAGACPPSA
jgi:hypothetical protein